MNAYYVRITDCTGLTTHHDLRADSPQVAAEQAAHLARGTGALGDLRATVYESVGTHNILAQREPVLST